MATTSRVHEPQETECSICLRHFVMPKILPCGHLFCRGCIVTFIDSRNEAKCPVCGNRIIDGARLATTGPETIADSLPTDQAMSALVESVGTLAQEPVCCVCDGVRADSICLQCLDMLCTACANGHRKMSATHSHDVESLSTVTPERLAASRPALCADHGDKQAEFFCKNHGVAICAACAIVQHRACLEVKDLASEVRTAEESIKVLADNLTAVETNMKQCIDEMDICLNSSTSCQNLCDILMAICSEQKEFFASPASKNATKNVKKKKSELHNCLAKVITHKHIVARAGAVCSRAALISFERALKDRVKMIDKRANVRAGIERTSHNNFIRRIKTELSQQQHHEENPNEDCLTFHKNRGCSVILGQKEMSAECPASFGGVVVLSNALKPQFLYQVVVKDMSRIWQPDDFAFCGVTGTHPNDLSIKRYIWDMEDVLTVCPQRDGGLNEHVIMDDIIGLMIDSTNSLHLFLNGRDLGIVVIDAPRPCYAVFDLDINIREVLALPVIKIAVTTSSQGTSGQGTNGQGTSGQGTSGQDMSGQGTRGQGTSSHCTSSQDMSSHNTI